MNYNDIRAATEASRARRLKVVSPPDPAAIQRAEMAVQTLSHPGWDMFTHHLQEKLAEAHQTYAGIKERLATGYHMPHDYHWLHLQANEVRGGIKALEYVLGYLPGLVKTPVTPGTP